MLTLKGFWEGTNKPAAENEVHLSITKLGVESVSCASDKI